MSLRRYLLPTLNQAPRDELVPTLVEGSGIPRLISQIYLSGDPLPSRLVENVEQLRKVNPGWAYRLWDEHSGREFIRANYPDVVCARYDQISPDYGAARADLLRYLLMYKLGGVYLDIKSAATRPFDEVLRPDDSYVLSQWTAEDMADGWGRHHDIADPRGEFQQWHIICAPGHPFLKAVIEYVLRNIALYNPGLHGVGKFGVLRVTGPVAYTRAIQPLLAQARHRRAEAQRDLGLEYSIFRDDEHMMLFNSRHYSKLVLPIVSLGPFKQITAPFFQFLRSFWGRLRLLASASRGAG